MIRSKKIILGLFVICVLVVANVTFAAPASLKVIMGLGEDEWKVMRSDILPGFESKYNVKVEAYQAESQDTVKILQSRIMAKKMDIDVFSQDNMNLAPFVENKLVEDLTAYKSMIPATALKPLIANGTFGGKIFFMPYRPNVEITYYNSKKFAEFGLKPPANWDELLAVAKAFKEKEGVGRVGIKLNLGPDSACHAFDFIRAAGGDPVVLNDAGCVKAFTYLQQLYPYLAPDSKTATWDTMNKMVATESAYIGANWPFGVNVIVKDGGKKEILAYHGWAGPARESHVLGGEMLGIPKGSPNKKLALKFIEYLLSKEVQEKLVSKMGWPASRTDAYGKVEEWQKPYFQAVNDALKFAEARPNLVYWDAVQKAVNEALREVVIEQRPVKDTLDKWHNYIEQNKR